MSQSEEVQTQVLLDESTGRVWLALKWGDHEARFDFAPDEAAELGDALLAASEKRDTDTIELH